MYIRFSYGYMFVIYGFARSLSLTLLFFSFLLELLRYRTSLNATLALMHKNLNNKAKYYPAPVKYGELAQLIYLLDEWFI